LTVDGSTLTIDLVDYSHVRLCILFRQKPGYRSCWTRIGNV